ncbi:MAG: coenzyme F420-0:L-glutamate ligase [Pseudomonadota bacterium]
MQIIGLQGIPLIKEGDDIAAFILAALEDAADALEDGDIVVVAQKIVSKTEGRLIPIASVEAGDEAIELAARCEKDPRIVELILSEASEVVRSKPGVILVRHRLGNVGANAGIDQSNIEHGGGEAALLLPLDPDASALELHERLSAATGKHIGVIIADSMNRPWRLGTIGCAIGCAGVLVLDDLRGHVDMFGREMKVAMVNCADSIAAAATLIMGESTEGVPAALVKGFAVPESPGRAADIIRAAEDDLFR